MAIDRSGHLSTGMFMLLPLALMVAVLALTLFPETAQRELEEINPEDDLSLPGGEVIAPLEHDHGELAAWLDPDGLGPPDPGANPAPR